MSSIDKAKNLIGQGKTEDALTLLRELLTDRDAGLLNQVLLLNAQLADAKKRKQLNTEDAESDINRINYTLLTLCDEAKQYDDDAPVIQNDEPKSSVNILIIYGIIVAIGLLFIFLAIKYLPN